MQNTLRAFLLVVLWASSAFAAEFRRAHAYRYRTTYSEWNSGISGYYGYEEKECKLSRKDRVFTETCYNMAPNSYVYVEEKHLTNGYSRIDVYQTEAANDAYVTYYVYDTANRHYVEKREFYHHEIYGHSVTQTNYYLASDDAIYTSPVWATGWELLIVGTFSTLVGVEVLAHSDGNSAAVVAGLISVSAGLLSSSSASDAFAHASSLQMYMNKEAEEEGRDVR